MSKTVDERIVSMEFDNKRFEKNVATSMSTLDKLKEKLNFTGASKGLEEVNAASKKVDMNGLGNGVDTVKMKFSALQTMATTALVNITNSAVNAGKRIVASLTIEPVKMGFSEYETQLNAVQTILANTESKGTTLDDVNAALDTLNEYADKTIYNFTQMTKNIGTFTAAGIDLDTSVSAIQGIANLAAVSGSNSQQASTAMYQLSQALASGTVKLMDWNSVVNAGMGGQVFQDALKETARVHGVAVDEMIQNNGSFRESLKEGWITSEILTETLKHFTMAAEEGSEEWNNYMETLKAEGYTEKQAEEILRMANTATDAATKVKTFTQLLDTLKESAQSGWTQTWEILIGDFEEAKELWTAVSDTIGGMIGQSADFRNELLSKSFSSGWKQFFGEGLVNETGYQDWIKTIVQDTKQINMDDLMKDGKSFEEVLRDLINSGDVTSETLGQALNKLAEDTKGLNDAELANLGITKEQRDKFLELNEEIQNGSGILDEYTEKMGKLSGKELVIESFVNLWKTLNKLIEPVKKALNEIFPSTAVENVNETAEGIYGLIQRFHDFTSSIEISEETLDKIRRTFKGVFAAVDIVLTILKAFGSVIGKVMGVSGGLVDVILTITAKLGDAIVKVRDFIKDSDSIQKVVNGIAKVFKFLVKLVTNFTAAMDDLAEEFKKLDISWLTDALMVLVEMLKFVWDILSTVFNNIKKAFENTFNGDGFSLDQLVKIFTTGAIGVFVVKLIQFIKSFTQIKEKFTGGLREFLNEIKDIFTEFQMQNLKMSAFKNMAIAIGILVGSLLVLTLIDHDKLLAAIATLMTLIGSLLLAFKYLTSLEVKDAKQFAKASGVLIKMSIALLVAAFAIKKLGSMEWDEWGRGLIGMSVTLGTLIGCLWLMKKMNTGGVGAEKGIKTLLKISAVLLIVAVAVRALGSMPWNTWGRGLIGMGAALGILIGSLWLMKKMRVASKNASEGSWNLVVLSGSLLVVAGVMKILGSMSWEQFGVAISAMGSVLALLIGAIWVMDKMKTADSKGCWQLVALSGSLLVIAGVMKILATMSWSQFAVSIAAMGSALAVLVGALWVLQVAKVDSKGALALLVTCPTLLTIAGVMKILGTMSWSEYAVAITAMASTLTALVGALAIMSLLKGNNVLAASSGLLIMAAAIGLLVPSLMLLGGLKVGTIVKGVATIASVLLVLAGACALLARYQKIIILVGAAVALLGVGCTTAGLGMIFFVTALDILIDAIVEGGPAFVQGLIAIINGIADSIPHIMQKIGEGFVAFCGAIRDGAPALRDAFIVLIESLCQAIIESSDTIAESIVITLTDLNEAIVKVVPTIVEGIARIILKVLELLVKYIPQFVDKIFDLVIGLIETLTARIPDLNYALVGMIDAFFVSLVDALKQADSNVLLEGILAVGLVTALMVMLASLVALTPAAMLGVLGVGLVIAEMSLVLAALGLLSKWDGLITAVSNSSKLLGAIGTAIGTFIGNLVGAAGEAISGTLPGIGTDLSDFMTNLTPFLDGLKSLDASTLESAKTLASVIMTLTAANLLESITSFFTGESSMGQFGKELALFGNGLKEFSNQVSGIDTASVTAAADAGKILAEMAHHIPNSGGLIGLFTGENDLGEFGVQLRQFGNGIKQFANNTKGIDVTSVTAAANAGKTLAEMANGIPNTGGIKSWFEGDNTLADFGDQLGGFGTGVAEFGNEVKDVNPVAITAAANAGKTLAQMAASIPNTGGIVTWFAGDNKMADFASGLSAMAGGIRSFSNIVSAVSIDFVNKGVTAGKAIVTMARDIPNEGGMVTWFTGDNKMADFASGLDTFATGIYNFGNIAANISMDGIQNGVVAARAIISMATSIPNEGGIISWFTGDNGIGSFADNLVDLGESIKEFSSLVNESSVSGATSMISGLSDSLNDMSAETVAHMKNAFSVTKNDLTTIFTDMFTSINEIAVDKFRQLRNIASINTLELYEEILRRKTPIVDAFKGIATESVEAISSEETKSKFSTAGYYLVEGFANGIEDSSYLAEAKAKAVATAAKDAINEALGIESPSKELYKSGVYSIEGYVNALTDYAYKAYDAGSNVGEEAKTGLSAVIRKISDAIESDMDTNPTIRPVLDLSDVNKGINTMNGMFNMAPSMGVMARVNSINSSMNKNQNDGNSEVVSAINGLKDTMKASGGDTYNINGVTYSDGSEIQSAIETIVRAIIRERRS